MAERWAIYRKTGGSFFCAADSPVYHARASRRCRVATFDGGRRIAESWSRDAAEASEIRAAHHRKRMEESRNGRA